MIMVHTLYRTSYMTQTNAILLQTAKVLLFCWKADMRRVTEIAVVRRSADTNRDGGERRLSVSATPNVSACEPSAANMERDRLGQWTYSDGNKETMSTNLIRGLDHMRDPRLNKVSHKCNNRLGQLGPRRGSQLTNITSLFMLGGSAWILFQFYSFNQIGNSMVICIW